MNPVKALQTHGQSVWLDFLARGFVAKGDLKKLIDSDGVRGVTSNPAIFEKAIGASDEYDAPLGEVLNGGDRGVADTFEALAVQDIRHAADVLRPVYDALKGADGFVSLEVSPYLARDTKATIAEAEKLWRAVDRKNLMIKVPATAEGLPAIRHLIGKGISVNITLLFAQSVYRDVAEAYLAGLETYAAGGGDPSHVASVASFFVSRIDAVADKQLDEKIATTSGAEKDQLAALKGEVAIANAKLAYQDYKKLFAGPRWDKLAAKGAKPQRLLWASTGTKNKDYRDTLYVEELIGKDTVNTVPPATLDAFRDHGRLRDSLEEKVDDAARVLKDFAAAGFSLDTITADLVVDGVKQFADAADKLYGAVAHKRGAALGDKLGSQKLTLGALEKPYKDALEMWRKDALIRRLWQRDASVWTDGNEAKWLGWLDSVDAETAKLGDYKDFAGWVTAQGFSHAVVLGMGGSSLGPEVLARTFKQAAGFPTLHVLDSTDPAQVKAMADRIDLARTLFIVSSKSGGTTEPNVMKDYFVARVGEAIGQDRAGGRFVAVTDPGSSLEKVAKQQGFARIFYGNPEIGGRYSVLSPFGMVPAAAAGIDLTSFLGSAATMVRACASDAPPAENPGVQLGAVMGVAGLAGRDKVTITASKSFADFGAWAEQLIAESTGKDGKGLIPIDAEPLAGPEAYGNDRLFIDIVVKADSDDAHEAKLAALEKAGHPVVRIAVTQAGDLGQEFVRFEMATAVAGALLGIDPFNQPDVEAAKIKTRELIAAFDKAGSLPQETAVASDATLAIYTDDDNAAALKKAGASADPASWIAAQIARIKPGDYAALLAYIDHNDKHIVALQAMRLAIRNAKHVATCAEFGPRFLHSTGQAYKGGPDSGVFIQITADDAADLAVPGQKATFGIIKAAQARGDFGVLTERGRRALRVHITGDLATGLQALARAIASGLK